MTCRCLAVYGWVLFKDTPAPLQMRTYCDGAAQKTQQQQQQQQLRVDAAERQLLLYHLQQWPQKPRRTCAYSDRSSRNWG